VFLDTEPKNMELRDVYVRNDQVVSRRIVDELILVPIRKNVADAETLYTLNEVGARVYELIDGARPVHDIVSAIVSEFEISGDEARTDVLEFISQLLEIDSIRKIEDAD